MLFARVDGRAARATPGAQGRCPDCDDVMLPKCGSIMVHHWAHMPTRACSDAWAEESQWHLEWKLWALEQGWNVEVAQQRDGVRHRADIVTSTGHVIELQHSPLDARVIQQREQFYGRMVWVWDMREVYDADRLVLRTLRRRPGSADQRLGLRFRRPRWSLCTIRRPLYFDIGSDWALLHVTGLRRIPSYYRDGDVCLGFGQYVATDAIAEWLTEKQQELFA